MLKYAFHKACEIRNFGFINEVLKKKAIFVAKIKIILLTNHKFRYYFDRRKEDSKV